MKRDEPDPEYLPEPPEIDEADEVPPVEEAVEPFTWNEDRDLALLRIALPGGQSAAEIAEKLAGRPEFAATWIDGPMVAKRLTVLRAEVAAEGVAIPRLLPDRYRPDGKKLAAALKAVDRRGEV